VAVDDPETVGEDSGATDFDVLANDTDADEVDEISITGVDDPLHGTTSIVAGKVRYTPDADYCNSGEVILDDFDYTVSGGDTGTVSVTVTCAGEARADSATVAEDSDATEIDVEDNDDDGELEYQIDSVSNPAHGSAGVVQGDPDSVNYTPDADYCNNPGAEAADTFTYTLDDDATATVSVTVMCEDDDSVAVDDARNVAQDSGATAFDVLANDTDVDGGPKAIDSASDPAHGAVAVASDGAALTYEPDRGYCTAGGAAADEFSYELESGDTASVRATVTCKRVQPPGDSARPKRCRGKVATIEVKPGGALTSGTAGRDVIIGTSGKDRIRGLGGDDVVCAGAGDDRVEGNSGDDQLLGEAGKDRVSGNAGDDKVDGDSGADRLSGGSGKDFVQGYGGRDRVSGGSGNDRVSGNSGNDRISGGSGRDRIWGRSGVDRIFARDGLRDSVNCGSGADTATLDARDRNSRC
jgi:Ca2+-binding RTX toxin-like protein